MSWTSVSCLILIAVLSLSAPFRRIFIGRIYKQALSEIKRVLADDGRFIIACEQSKVTYYLPDLKDNKEFADYLDKMGLRLLDCQKQAAWLCYVIAKQ